MSKIVSVHSFRGGTGKSNTTANLASLLAMEGLRVGVVDTDIASPGIHVLFNFDENEMVHSLNDYLWGKCSIKETAHDVSGHLGAEIKGQIYLIPASIKAGEIARILREGYDVGLLNDGFRDLVKEMKLDFLMIDTHPGLNEETLLSIAISDILLVILRPDTQDFQGTAVTVDIARSLDVTNLLLMVNKAVPNKYDYADLKEQIETSYKAPLTGILPLNFELADNASKDLFALRVPDHAWSRELVKVAESILKVE